MNTHKRWVLLRHTDAPDDKQGIHYDLLLEDETACRTWRLNEMPVLNGRAVQVVSVPLHKLEWLEKVEAEVSGGRGLARRIIIGTYQGNLPTSASYQVTVNLYSDNISGRLEIKNGFCRILSL